jgi:hypothetical protein
LTSCGFCLISGRDNLDLPVHDRNSMLDQYGELYHAAWKRGAGPVLRVLEHDCVQDLANHCIHAASPALASALRRVLGAFHAHKKFRAVDELLHRIYEPILWRALRVANAAVRRQAALLFVDAFPVQDPDAANADFEQVPAPQCTARVDPAGPRPPAPAAPAAPFEAAVRCGWSPEQGTVFSGSPHRRFAPTCPSLFARRRCTARSTP